MQREGSMPNIPLCETAGCLKEQQVNWNTRAPSLKEIEVGSKRAYIFFFFFIGAFIY